MRKKIMNNIKYFFLLIFLVGVSGCETTGSNEESLSYEEALSQRPIPTDNMSLQKECGYIRSEIARMQSASAMSSGSQFALVFQIKARNNIALLEARASNIGCRAAFSSIVAPPEKPRSQIQECIDACTTNTNRTSEACFDQCNK